LYEQILKWKFSKLLKHVGLKILSQKRGNRSQIPLCHLPNTWASGLYAIWLAILTPGVNFINVRFYAHRSQKRKKTVKYFCAFGICALKAVPKTLVKLNPGWKKIGTKSFSKQSGIVVKVILLPIVKYIWFLWWSTKTKLQWFWNTLNFNTLNIYYSYTPTYVTVFVKSFKALKFKEVVLKNFSNCFT